MVKQRDEWSGLAEFLGNMIAKYADTIDFDSLPEPDEYLARRCMKRMYRAYRREQRKLQKKKNDVEVEYNI